MCTRNPKHNQNSAEGLNKAFLAPSDELVFCPQPPPKVRVVCPVELGTNDYICRTHYNLL